MRRRMGFENLSEMDRKLYEYIKQRDFETYPWSTAQAARYLGVTEQDVYESLARLAKEIPDNIWIHYKDGAIRVSAE